MLKVAGNMQSDLINNLNNDCLRSIFTYIPIQQRFILPRVCKRWNSDLVWGGIQSLLFEECCVPALVQRGAEGLQLILQKCGHNLHNLDLKQEGKSAMLPIVSKYCKNLRRLVITLDHNDCKYRKWCIQMKELQCFQIIANSQFFSETFFNSLPQKNLTQLQLSVAHNSISRVCYKSRLSPTAANALAKLTRLTALTMGGFVLTYDIVTIISQMSNLKFLSLACCTAPQGLLPLTHLTNLTCLYVNNIGQVDDSFVIEVSKNCKNLTELTLGNSNDISDDSITTLQTLPQLEKLALINLRRITDGPLSKLHTLKLLECQACDAVKNDGIITLMKYAPNLKYLNLIDAKVSCKVLTEANKILKRRSNDIELLIDIRHTATKRWNNGNCPPLLQVRGI